jgi:hypothetical protein
MLRYPYLLGQGYNNWVSPVHILTSYFSKIDFNIMSHILLRP